jgi:uncharacterized membrane protein YhhN
MALLGIILLSICAAAFLIRPRRRFFRLGLDSWLVTALYFLGMYALGFLR